MKLPVLELLVSFAVAMAAAPLVLRVLVQHGVLDVPNNRSSHVTPVPRGGGIACLAGVLAGLILASALGHDVPWLAVSGAVILAVVGFADDQGALAAAPRLGAQLPVGALVGASIASILALTRERQAKENVKGPS